METLNGRTAGDWIGAVICGQRDNGALELVLPDGLYISGLTEDGRLVIRDDYRGVYKLKATEATLSAYKEALDRAKGRADQ